MDTRGNRPLQGLLCDHNKVVGLIIKLYHLKDLATGHRSVPAIVRGNEGIARTQSPTNKNYAAKFPTFGEIVGVNRPAVQWNSLVLGELPP